MFFVFWFRRVQIERVFIIIAIDDFVCISDVLLNYTSYGVLSQSDMRFSLNPNFIMVCFAPVRTEESE